ncbi:hypothetical protein ACJJID_04000 [Microbulbifer sp. CnH-101-G]|uniref:hypothetical protein n=1 Tax=Microbulbifer sp. CnH-101-G TaxID=3243393 RepID=UPI00403908A8
MSNPFNRIISWALSGLIFLIATTLDSKAHFTSSLDKRIIIIEHTPEEINLYVRLPLSYLLTNKVELHKEKTSKTTYKQFPYINKTIEKGELKYYVDLHQFAESPTGLGNLAEKTTNIYSENKQLEGRVQAVRLYRIGYEPKFKSLEEAKDSFIKDYFPYNTGGPVHVNDSLIDIKIKYDLISPVSEYQLSSKLNPRRIGQEEIKNEVWEYHREYITIIKNDDLLNYPISFQCASKEAATTHTG